jgi:periplasmic divalent cation tolerance protein
MTDVIQVITTTSSQEEAQTIARALVERRLAACVQVIGPISSTYHWKGAIETSTEWLCLAKTLASLYAEVEQAIRGLHSYDVPEILAVRVTFGARGYLDWLSGELIQGSGPETA